MHGMMRLVAGATVAVAAVALVGFGLHLPAATVNAATADAATVDAGTAGGMGSGGDHDQAVTSAVADLSVTAHAALLAGERIASTAALLASGHALVTATDGFIDPAPRAALDQALTDFEAAPVPVAQEALSAKAGKAEAARGALEVVRTLVVATGRRVLDGEVPDAGAARDALAESLADPALLTVGPTTSDALLAVVAATRGAQDAQAAAVAASASSSGGTGGGSGGSTGGGSGEGSGQSSSPSPYPSDFAPSATFVFTPPVLLPDPSASGTPIPFPGY